MDAQEKLILAEVNNPHLLVPILTELGETGRLRAPFSSKTWEPAWAARLFQGTGKLLSVVSADAIVGMMSAAVVQDEFSGALTCLVSNGYVQPAYRGQGAGTALLLGMERWAREKGCKRFSVGYLDVEEWPQVDSWFRSLGLAICEHWYLKEL